MLLPELLLCLVKQLLLHPAIIKLVTQLELLHLSHRLGLVPLLQIEYLLLVLFLLHPPPHSLIPLLHKLPHPRHKVRTILVHLQLILVQTLYLRLECTLHQLLVLALHPDFVHKLLLAVSVGLLGGFAVNQLATLLVYFRHKGKLLRCRVAFACVRFQWAVEGFGDLVYLGVEAALFVQ